jgi:hypothetical protein
MTTTCPFCDSESVEKIEIEETYPIPFCEEVIIPHELFRCLDCEEEGDFDNSLDKVLIKEIADANRASAPTLIDSLVRDGITMTYLEKALRLPFRTTTRWKKGKISQSALALLRLIRFSPALLEVADENFSEEAQARYHLTQPRNFFDKYFSNQTYSLTISHGVVELGYQGEMVDSLYFQTNSQNKHEVIEWEPVQ